MLHSSVQIQPRTSHVYGLKGQGWMTACPLLPTPPIQPPPVRQVAATKPSMPLTIPQWVSFNNNPGIVRPRYFI